MRVLITDRAYLLAQLENGQTNRDKEGEEAQGECVECLDLQNADGHGNDGDCLQQNQHQYGHGQFAQPVLLSCVFKDAIGELSV